MDEITAHDFVLTPGRYVGAAELEDDGERFEEKMERLTEMLSEQFLQSKQLQQAIQSNVSAIGYDVWLPNIWKNVTLVDIAKETYGLVDGPFGFNLKSAE